MHKRIFGGLVALALLPTGCLVGGEGADEVARDHEPGVADGPTWEAEQAVAVGPDCTITSQNLVALTDLGAGTYLGATGGLYPGSSNIRPAAHTQAAMTTVLPQIFPRDTQGNADPYGTVGFASLGMSHTNLIFGYLLDQAIAQGGLHPNVKLVNAAQGMYSASAWQDPANAAWLLFAQTLAAGGIAPAQLQVVWMVHTDIQPLTTPFPTRAVNVQDMLRDILHTLKSTYPNVQAVYISSLPYGAYRAGGVSGEPNFYENGFTLKWLIEEQITGINPSNGAPSGLDFTGAAPSTPWLSWAGYTWTDGVGPDAVPGGVGGRSDGFEWLCPEDLRPDGSHPSNRGGYKLATPSLEELRLDPTVTPWLHGAPVDTSAKVVLIKDEAGTRQLYASDVAGSVVTAPAGLMPAGRNVLDFEWSPDRNYIAFRADLTTDEVYELYVVPTVGGSVVKVSAAMTAGGDVGTYRWSPDSTLLAYMADQATDDVVELYRVPRTGAQVAKRMSGAMVTGGDVDDFAWAPSGNVLAYRADSAVDEKHELWKRTAISVAPARVHQQIAATADVSTYAWSPDGKSLAFLVDATVDGRFDLYFRGPSGAAQISQTPTNAAANVTKFAWSPDSLRLGYLIDDIVDEQYELFTAGIAALPAVPVKVSGALTPAGAQVYDFAFAPDGSRVAYTANATSATKRELFTTPPTVSSAVRVSATMQNALGQVTDFTWAPDSSLLAYLSDPVLLGQRRLSATGASSSAGALNVSTKGDTVSFQWAPDSSRLAYIADIGTIDGVYELLTNVPTAGGVEVRVTGAMVFDENNVVQGDVYDFKWSSDGSRLFYTADQWTDGIVEIFSSFPDTAVGNALASGDLALNSDVVAMSVR